jgi:sugar fermentation stimulation protein A
MKFIPPLQKAIFCRRYKRFLADIQLPNGEITTIHCPNTGAMLRCLVEKSPCWYSISNNPKRRYPLTWEIATTVDGHLAGIYSGRANQLVKEAIDNGVIIELQGYDQASTEVRYGQENSRVDLLLQGQGRPDCYVEVKSVTLGMDGGGGFFPDAISQRGSKHLRELMMMLEQGHRAVLLFCVQHSGIKQVSPADHIDPLYGQTLREAIKKGVEVFAYGAHISAKEITLVQPLNVIIDGY